MSGIYRIKPRFQVALGGVEAYLVRRRVHPDVLTLGALGLALVGGGALWAANGLHPLLLLLAPIALARTALNALDGLVARGTGLARPWGEVLNEFSDRLADVALFAGVALAPGSSPALGAVVLVTMLLSSYLGTVAKAAGGRRQYGGVMGKADRMLYLGVAAVLAFLLPAVPVFSTFLVVVFAGLIVTLGQRLGATYVDLQPRH
ncbi:MAG TPA: CDP-alcohol phosphatidyltransferase family protein [Chloroflexia bacterium]|nr:CDP-alcohol phosphatidyltransferase family protein [Chloroflexia bacterium]